MGDIFFVSALTHEADVEFYGLGDGFQTNTLVVAMDGEMCIRDRIGEIVKPGFVTAHFSAVLKANNLPHIRFHDLRHSCASLLFAQGVSLKEIQAWLGHSTIGTTANIYTHLDENNKLSSANAIIAILPEM